MNFVPPSGKPISKKKAIEAGLEEARLLLKYSPYVKDILGKYKVGSAVLGRLEPLFLPPKELRNRGGIADFQLGGKKARLGWYVRVGIDLGEKSDLQQTELDIIYIDAETGKPFGGDIFWR